MNTAYTIGWDLGGAHLKAALISADGVLEDVVQLPCPLWQQIGHLGTAVDQVLRRWPQATRHAVTMTGEMVDLFADRDTGVSELVACMQARIEASRLLVFTGRDGFVDSAEAATHSAAIASANWLATATHLSRQIPSALFVDIGSTTTDVVAIVDGRVAGSSTSDADRLASDELVYTGVVRTPVCAMVTRVPFKGRWQTLAAELFATSADVYRLLGELPDHADQMATADGRGKSVAESEARLARMLGRDCEAGERQEWRQLAGFLARRQQQQILDAVERVSSSAGLADDAPLVAAGVGRFVTAKLACSGHRPYHDFATFCGVGGELADRCADCAPAVAVGLMAVPALVRPDS